MTNQTPEDDEKPNIDFVAQKRQRNVFPDISASKAWDYCPEIMMECAPLSKQWREINAHLSKPLPALFGYTVIVLFIPGIAYLFWVVKMVIAASSLATVATIVDCSKFFYLFAIVLLALLCGLIKLWRTPTHLGIGRFGVRLHWQRGLVKYFGKTMDWLDMTEIKLVQPPGTTLPEQCLLTFEGHIPNWRKRPNQPPPNEWRTSPKTFHRIQVRLGEIVDSSHIPLLYDAILSLGKNVPRDANLDTLLGDTGNSYTELWLKALTAPPDRDRLTPLPPGAALKQASYIVKDRIGAGGQGVAYLARQKKGDELVVLKEYVLPVQVSVTARTEAIEKLQREAEILSKINHPQIVHLQDSFFEDHRGYLVLEYVEGINLHKLVKANGPLKEPQAIEYLSQMCDILSCLHEKERPIIHRDFTPDNLILTKSGAIKLIDFNVASEHSADSVTATVVGKHSYIAPEQFRGKPVPASDLYSLGATMYFLLTGKEPKPITTSKPKDSNPELSEDINQLVSKLTSMQADNRPASATAIKALIEKMKSQLQLTEPLPPRSRH